MLPTAEDYDRIYLNKQARTVLEVIEAEAINDAEINALRCTGLINAQERRQILAILAAFRPGAETSATILDLGCGTGRLGIWLAQQLQVDLIGIDFSTIAISLAQQQPEATLGKYNFDVKQFEETGIASSSIAGAFSLDAVYLSRSPDLALSEVARVLQPQSPFVFTYYVDPRAAVNWPDLIADAGLRLRSTVDLTESWRRTMRIKHQLRWDRRHQISVELGDRAPAEMSVTQSMLGIGGRSPYIDATSRYLVNTYKP